MQEASFLAQALCSIQKRSFQDDGRVLLGERTLNREKALDSYEIIILPFNYSAKSKYSKTTLICGNQR
jgi:hypothetical protein